MTSLSRSISQLSNPNRLLKIVLMRVEIIENSSDISTTLANDFIASHSLSQSPQIPRVDDFIFDGILGLKSSPILRPKQGVESKHSTDLKHQE